ncbi:hypothetical protein EV426DRAFT_712601 [Tirmania nivea]|nr:hypothetical protein EV426DRAFT_712601 [Tirmania nivea]
MLGFVNRRQVAMMKRQKATYTRAILGEKCRFITGLGFNCVAKVIAVRKVDSLACPDCDHPSEDGHHITFDCPKHHQQRQEFIGDARTWEVLNIPIWRKEEGEEEEWDAVEAYFAYLYPPPRWTIREWAYSIFAALLCFIQSWQIPQPALTVPPPVLTQFFPDIVVCPFSSTCQTSWTTPVLHYAADDDVDYSDYRLHFNVVTRIQAHFQTYHSHIRGETQINITVNRAGKKFALSTGQIGQCPTCHEQLVRPTKGEKSDPYVCIVMAKSVSDHRWANRACRDRFLSLYTGEDLENVIPKTIIWGHRLRVDKTERPIDGQAKELESLDVTNSQRKIADDDGGENTAQRAPGPSRDDDKALESIQKPVDLMVPNVRRQRREGRTKRGKGARAHKFTTEPASSLETSSETTPSSSGESLSGTENSDKESTAPSSPMEDVTMPFPTASNKHILPQPPTNNLAHPE